jgi:hypothetical protein
MAEIKKHALLLSLLALLIVLKFVVVPIFDWQDQLILNIESQQKQATRMTKVLTDDDDQNTNRQALATELEKIERLFFSYRSDAAFKLEQQQAFEQLLEKHQLRSSNIGWQAETELQGAALKRYQMKIKFSGLFVDAVAMFIELESTLPWSEIEDFNISTRGTQKDNLGSIRSGNLTINLFMHNSPPILDREEG